MLNKTQATSQVIKCLEDNQNQVINLTNDNAYLKKENNLLKDKLRRRNMQIKELKNKTKELTPRFENNYEMVSNSDLEELSNQIKEGYTSGRIDNDEGKHIYWEIKVNVWKN